MLEVLGFEPHGGTVAAAFLDRSSNSEGVLERAVRVAPGVWLPEGLIPGELWHLEAAPHLERDLRIARTCGLEEALPIGVSLEGGPEAS